MAKQFLFHVTPKENVQSILSGGLKRKGFAVYCSEKPYSWWTPDLALLKVRISGLPHEMTTFLPESDEILIWGDVPPERLFLCEANREIPRKIMQRFRRAYRTFHDSTELMKEEPT